MTGLHAKISPCISFLRISRLLYGVQKLRLYKSKMQGSLHGYAISRSLSRRIIAFLHEIWGLFNEFRYRYYNNTLLNVMILLQDGSGGTTQPSSIRAGNSSPIQCPFLHDTLELVESDIPDRQHW